MAYTEFYCNNDVGSNTNAGSTEVSPVATITAGAARTWRNLLSRDI